MWQLAEKAKREMHQVPLEALPAAYTLTAPELAYDKMGGWSVAAGRSRATSCGQGLANRKRDLLLQYAST